jgi:hypothetical protein
MESGQKRFRSFGFDIVIAVADFTLIESFVSGSNGLEVRRRRVRLVLTVKPA